MCPTILVGPELYAALSVELKKRTTADVISRDFIISAFNASRLAFSAADGNGGLLHPSRVNQRVFNSTDGVEEYNSVHGSGLEGCTRSSAAAAVPVFAYQLSYSSRRRSDDDVLTCIFTAAP